MTPVIFDNLCAKAIKKGLKNPDNFDILVLSEIDSTNKYLKTLAASGEKEGRVIIADCQTAGHGRYDRKFYSPKGCGIYLSYLFKPTLKVKDSVLVTAAAAVAAAKACEKLSGEKLRIKWVNDLLIDGKKICGILTEGAINPKNQSFDWVVLGIGINVYRPENDFNDEIKQIAGALFKEKKENLRNTLCAEFLNLFEEYCKNLESKSFLEDYRNRLAFLGDGIFVLREGEKIPAKALDVDDDCNLLVEYEDSSREYLYSGEITIRPRGALNDR